MLDLQVRTPRLFIRPMREEDRDKFVSFYERSWAEMVPWFPVRLPGETFAQTFEKTLAKANKGAEDQLNFGWWASRAMKSLWHFLA